MTKWAVLFLLALTLTLTLALADKSLKFNSLMSDYQKIAYKGCFAQERNETAISQINEDGKVTCAVYYNASWGLVPSLIKPREPIKASRRRNKVN